MGNNESIVIKQEKDSDNSATINKNAKGEMKSAKDRVRIVKIELKWFLSKAFFAYLPLCVYLIVNVPYFQETKCDILCVNNLDDRAFMKGLFLTLSYVFIAHLNVHSSSGFWHSLKIFCAVICLALYTTDKFSLNWWLFACLFVVSAIMVYSGLSNKDNELKPNKLSNEVSL